MPEPASADASVPVSVTVVESLAELESYAPAWDALVVANGPACLSAFVGAAWTISHLETRVADGDTWRCYLAHRGTELVGVLPLVRRSRRKLGIRLARAAAPGDPYLVGGAPVLRPGAEVEVLTALFASVDRHERPVLSVRMGGLRLPSPVPAALRKATGSLVLEERQGDGRVLRLSGDWDAFLKGLGSNFRRSLRKARNRLKAMGEGGPRRLVGADADPAYIETFLDFEAAGWKGKHGAVRDDPVETGFYRVLTRRLAAAGQLEWHVLDIGGAPAAIHLGMRLGRTLTLIRIAFDETWGRLSPGTLLLADLVEGCLAAGEIDVIDCITDTAWHERWAMDRIPYRAVQVHARRPLPLLLDALPMRAREGIRSSPRLLRLARRVKGLLRSGEEPAAGS